MKVYRIKDTTTGMYSEGKISPVFTKTGRIFRNLNAVKTHLTYLKKYNIQGTSVYNTCVLVEYDLSSGKERPLP